MLGLLTITAVCWASPIGQLVAGPSRTAWGGGCRSAPLPMGDDQQLSAVASGGAMRYLKNAVGAVYLEDLHRFRNADGTPNTAEVAATLALREPPAAGEDDPWEFYRQNRRVVGGDVETMTSQVYTAWEKDTSAGKHSA